MRPQNTPMRSNILARAAVVGLLVGAAHLAYHIWTRDPYLGDFYWAVAMGDALLRGHDPYGFTPSAGSIPYPLPVVLFGTPVLWLVELGQSVLAGSVFVGFSAGLLSWGTMRAGQTQRLVAILLSGVFWSAVMIGQWSPLIVATWYVPVLAPILVIVKPQTALPVVLARWPSRLGMLLAAIVVLASLAVYPTWPFKFLGMLDDYQRIFPALVLPLGPLLFLSVLRWRDERGRLLLMMSVFPIRAFYDTLGLWLVPRTTGAALLLSAISWPLVFGPVNKWLGGPSAILALFLAALAIQNRLFLEDAAHRVMSRGPSVYEAASEATPPDRQTE